MPNYRRALVPGASWFFTVNLLERRGNDLLVHRGMTDRFPYDGIAEGASIVYREPAASTTQHRNRPTHLNVGLRLRLIQPTLAEHFRRGGPAPHDGIAKGASIVYREPAASTAQHRNRANPLERRITPSANPTYVDWTSRIGEPLFV